MRPLETHQEEILFITVHSDCQAGGGGADQTRTVVQIQEGSGVKHTVHLQVDMNMYNNNSKGSFVIIY